MADFRPKTYNVACLVRDQEYTLYTCPANCRTHVNLLYAVNASTGSPSLDIEWDRADGSHMHIIGDKNLTAGEFIQWSDAYIVLEPGETITVICGDQNNPHVDALCTVEEYFLPNRAQSQ